ncbi:MAG TPA: hypothetical protein VFQ00_10835 [Terriglobales bacterium]|nr:hypothetical protein [Terriglobales bacterium]
MVLQQAIEVGCTAELRAGDIAAIMRGQFVPQLVAGIPLLELRAQLSTPRKPRTANNPLSFQIAPIDLPGENQIAFLSGIASALGEHRPGNVVAAFVDEKSLRNAGDVCEFAADLALPIVYVELGKHRSRVASRSALKIPVISVDEADVVAAYRVAFESIEKARRGAGPTIIRGIACAPQFRERSRHSHFEPDDAVLRMEQYLASRNLWTRELRTQIESAFARE